MQYRTPPVLGDSRFIRTDDAGNTHSIWENKINADSRRDQPVRDKYVPLARLRHDDSDAERDPELQ